jgi:hypothetical protein
MLAEVRRGEARRPVRFEIDSKFRIFSLILSYQREYLVARVTAMAIII